MNDTITNFSQWIMAYINFKVDCADFFVQRFSISFL